MLFLSHIFQIVFLKLDIEFFKYHVIMSPMTNRRRALNLTKKLSYNW